MTTTASTRAASTRVADRVIEEAAKDRCAIALANRLIAESFHIIGIQTETRFEPVVWVHPDLRLAAAVARDAACYYKQGCDEGGAYRIGQLKRDGAVIQWIERPGRTAWWPTGLSFGQRH